MSEYDEYQVLREYTFDAAIVTIKRSTAALRKWFVTIRYTRREEGDHVAGKGRMFSNDRAAWQEFYGLCMAQLENEAALWYNSDAAKDDAK